MSRCYLLFIGVVIACSILLMPVASWSAEWDQLPELDPPQKVAIKKSIDGRHYNEFRRCYRWFPTRVKTQYFGAVVEITDATGTPSPKDSDARPYADALYEKWNEQGRLDPDDHILVVYGIRNNALAIHPGEKWRKLGFEGEVIEDTIETSNFEQDVREQEYGQALCSLATVIDLRLMNLKRQMDTRIAMLAQTLPALEKRLDDTQKVLAERFADDHTFASKLLAEVAEAKRVREEAVAEREDEPNRAVHLVDEVEKRLEQVRTKIADYDEVMGRLDEVLEGVAALKADIERRPDKTWELPQAASKKLEQCQARAAEIRDTFEGEPFEVLDCQRKVESQLAEADVHYFYIQTVLPAVAVTLLVALLSWFLLARTLRRRRALALLEADLDQWEERLDEAKERLQQLQLTHTVYFAPRRELWEGQSAQLDQQAANAANRMALLCSEGRKLVERARSLYEKSHLLDVKRLEQALELLRDTRVELQAGVVDPRQCLFAPLTEPYASTANKLLGALEVAHWKARTRLEDLSKVSRRLAEQSARAGEAAGSATEAVEARRALELPANHLAEPLEGAMQIWRQARRLSDRDPSRAAQLFEQAADRFEALDELAAAGNAAIETVRGSISQMSERMYRDIRRLRFAQCDFKKLPSDPLEELDAVEHKAEHVEDLVAQGKEAEAVEALDALQAQMEDLDRRLETIKKSRDLIPEMVEELGARTQEILNDMVSLHYAFRRLSPDNDPDAYGERLETLKQFQPQLKRLPKRLEEVKEEHQNQYFLSAYDKLLPLQDLVERAETIVGEFSDIDAQVEQARAACEQIIVACKPSIDRLKARADAKGAGDGFGEPVAEQIVTYQMASDKIDYGQADWLNLRVQLEAMQDSVRFLDTELAAELEAIRQAQQLSVRLGGELSSLSQRGDTPAVCHGMLAQIQTQLDRWMEQLGEDAIGGRALLLVGETIGRALGRATKLATGETSPAFAARSQLVYAQRRFEEVDGRSYGYGARADCSHAHASLKQAATAHEAGDYVATLGHLEGAIEQIDLAEAHAIIEAERAFRRAQVRNITHQSPAAHMRLPGGLGNTSSWSNSMSSFSQIFDKAPPS